MLDLSPNLVSYSEDRVPKEAREEVGIILFDR
jgi:hypothetical protein